MIVVVAECGVNHRGDMGTAKKMIEKAGECGANIAKFQYFDMADGFLPEGDPRFEAVKRAQLSLDQLRELKAHCGRVGIEFLCTPFFSTRRVEELATLGTRRVKIREADSQREDMVKKALELFDEVYVSTTRLPVGNMFLYYHPHIKWLLTIPRYPAKIEELELDRIVSFDGYSNHIPDIIAPLATAVVAKALGKGEFILEIHVVLSHDDDVLDRDVSLDFSELDELVRHLRTIERIK